MSAVLEMHRDRDSDGDRRDQAARALLKARDEYRLSGWPGYSQRLPCEAASVQWAFDHLTPLHLLAKMMDCPFDDLLNMINACGLSGRNNSSSNHISIGCTMMPLNSDAAEPSRRKAAAVAASPIETLRRAESTAPSDCC